MEETHCDNKASSTTARTALGLSIGGLTLGLLNGGFGGLLGGFGGLGGGAMAAGAANLAQSVIAAKDAEIATLKSERYTDAAVSDLRRTVTDNLTATLYNLDKRVGQIETALPLQFARLDDKIACCCNAANAAIAALQNTVSGITKTIVPAAAVCPEPMSRYNSWTAPTTTTPAA